MFAYIKGRLEGIENGAVVIECGGVGFRISTSYNTIRRLPAQGNDVKMHTHFGVREDAMELYGFIDTAELTFFRHLISVSGVGPKAAMALLSEVTPDRLALAILSGDSKTLTRAPGIGGKTAGRIILELKDRIGSTEFGRSEDLEGALLSASLPAESEAAMAVEALSMLGYSRSEAAAAVARIDVDGRHLEEIVTMALKLLVR